MKRYQIHTKSKEHFHKVINILFSYGYTYGFTNCITFDDIMERYGYLSEIVIDAQKNHPMQLHGQDKGIVGVSVIYYSLKEYPLITLDDFLALPEPIQDISVILNEEYTAVISTDTVTVGCQKFPFDVIDKVAAAVDSMRKVVAKA